MPLVAHSYAGLSVPRRDRHGSAAGMMFIMWVYMETWIVQDGAPELGRGSYLPGVGLRADCLSVGPPRTQVDGIAELADRAGGQRPGMTGLWPLPPGRPAHLPP